MPASRRGCLYLAALITNATLFPTDVAHAQVTSVYSKQFRTLNLICQVFLVGAVENRENRSGYDRVCDNVLLSNGPIIMSP